MPGPDQTSLEDRLLRGGVAPRHAKRLSREYVEHFDDLVRAAGGNSQAALLQLGSPEDVVVRALSRPELKSWSGRWPWLVFGLGPVAISIALIVVLFFGVSWLAFLLAEVSTPSEAPNGIVLSEWQRTAIDLYMGTLTYALHPAVALATCLIASLRRHGMAPALVGATLVAIFGGGFESAATFADTPQVSNALLLTQDWIRPINPGQAVPAETYWRSLLNLVIVAPGLIWLVRSARKERSTHVDA